jgi:hypothetical protein
MISRLVQTWLKANSLSQKFKQSNITQTETREIYTKPGQCTHAACPLHPSKVLFFYFSSENHLVRLFRYAITFIFCPARMEAKSLVRRFLMKGQPGKVFWQLSAVMPLIFVSPSPAVASSNCGSRNLHRGTGSASRPNSSKLMSLSKLSLSSDSSLSLPRHSKPQQPTIFLPPNDRSWSSPLPTSCVRSSTSFQRAC